MPFFNFIKESKKKKTIYVYFHKLLGSTTVLKIDMKYLLSSESVLQSS